MTKQEYALARVRHSKSVDQWLALLGISQSSHDSYVSGRRAVPRYIEAHIETLDSMLMVAEHLEALELATAS